MGRITKMITLIAVLGALGAIPAMASAAVTPHVCDLPGGAVTGSGYTSCSFAAGMAEITHTGQCRSTNCVAYVHSSVTHQEYRVTCRYPRGFMSGDEVRCTSSGVDAWVKFFWFPSRVHNQYMPMDSIGMPECGGG